ncbi:MAG TPA: hypothetical protein VFV07_02495 [Rhizomicrobium sp.]|nr:hypothetical protein [Rhizomicrobium sp.]
MLRWFVLFLTVLAAPAAAAQDRLTVHSDLPFLPKPGQTVFPYTCGGADEIATCNEFQMGNWRVHELCGVDECGGWVGLRNYSPIHPALSFRETMTQDDDKPYEPALMIRLTPGSERKQLYALEIGFETGSSYMVLAGESEMPKHVEILDLRCEGDGAVRRGLPQPLGIFRTDYCSVASIDALERMAREALKRPPQATLDWTDDKPDEPGK